MAIATKVAKDLLNIKQGLHETLLQHAHRFKNARDVMKTKNGGFLELDALMEKAAPDYESIKFNSFKLEEAKKKTNERWLAHLFIENSDQTRHGSMIKKLREQIG